MTNHKQDVSESEDPKRIVHNELERQRRGAMNGELINLKRKIPSIRDKPNDPKRIVHNELERQRRGAMNGEFMNLKSKIPSIRDKPNVSKGTILKEAIAFIRNNAAELKEAYELQQENKELEEDIEILERAKVTGDVEAVNLVLRKYASKRDYEDDTSDLERPWKKSKLGCLDESQDSSDSGDESLDESEDNSVTLDLCESRLESENDRNLAYSSSTEFLETSTDSDELSSNFL